MKSHQQPIKILKIEQLNEFKLKLLFSDGKEQVVNFHPFLEHSLHPAIRKYLNPKKFKKFTLEDENLMWGDFDLIFPVMDLYKNQIN